MNGVLYYIYVDVAINSYAISPQTGSTFDGFIDCTMSHLFLITATKNRNDHSELVSAQCGRQSEPGLFSFVPLYIMCEKLNEKPCHVCQSFSKSPMTFDARRTMTIIHPPNVAKYFLFLPHCSHTGKNILRWTLARSLLLVDDS